MILKAFSFLDTKTGHFNTPFFMPHHGQAIRVAVDLADDLSTTIGRHPADFVLCELGEFDDQTGAFKSAVPVQLGVVTSFLPARPTPLFDPEANGLHDRNVTDQMRRDERELKGRA